MFNYKCNVKLNNIDDSISLLTWKVVISVQEVIINVVILKKKL